MSPRTLILRELDQLHQSAGNGTYARPSTIPGYQQRASKYQEAVNGLLKDRLIDGKKDEDGHMAIALNPHRLGDVKKELRPWFAKPSVWLLFGATVGIAAAPFLI